MTAERTPLDYDFDEKHLIVDGVDIAYGDEGAAASPDALPVLLVHGLGATLDHWALAIPLLARGHRVLALDLPGFGHSGKPDRHYGPQAYVELLSGFLDALGVARVFLIGHSLGGAVSAEFTLTHPSRVERLVLVDAAGMTRMPTRVLDFLLSGFERRVDPRKVILPPRLVRALVKIVFYEPVPFAARNAERILVSMEEADWGDRVRSFVRAFTGLSRSQVRDRLPEFTTPTLIVWGERDRVLPLRHGRMLKSGILDSRIVVFAKTGHCPMIEKPDEFCRVVEEFLAESGSKRSAGPSTGDLT